MPNPTFPSCEAHFDQNGAQSTPRLDLASLAGATDLFVISHGWNDDDAEARALYDGFFASVASLVADGTVAIPPGRAFRVLRVFWPSKRFDLPPAGAVAADAGDPALTAASAQLARLADAAGDPGAKAALAQARELLGTLDTDPDAADRFVRLVLSTATADAEDDDAIGAAFEAARDASGRATLGALGAAADSVAADASQQGVAAFGVASLLGGALNFLNLFTYKTMKARAGTVGVAGVAPLLLELRARYPALRIHLVGHSFGGRLVTSVANAFSGSDRSHRVSSMTLLQAAFSQFGFAKDYAGTTSDGAFRGTLLRDAVEGEIAVTHTVNDRANGLAYPWASRLYDQVASAVGDANDLFGAIGCNGAQATPEAVDDVLAEAGAAYAPLPAGRKLRNLRADAFVHAHGDVEGRQVAYAALHAALAAGVSVPVPA